MSADALAAKFQVLEELGSGSFGVVYKAIERESGTVVAIKQVRAFSPEAVGTATNNVSKIDLESSEDDIQEIQQEISVLSTCASPFVTQYYGSFVKGYKLWIIMEYLAGGSCLDLLKPGPFGEVHIAVLMRELLLGLDYLHREGKIHRDIKAANVLLSGTGHVKLADFGVAAQLSSLKSQRNTFVGTPFWMAPEVISQTHGYGFKADIWSLGITAMELAQGEPPNAAIHPMKVLFLIPKEPAPRLEGGRWSKEFKDFVERCLNKDPQKRASAKELLKHKFIRNAGRVQLLQDLIGRRRKWESSHGGRQSHPKLYQETMNTLSMGGEEDWDFDTIRTNPHATLRGSQYIGTTRNIRSNSGSSSGSGTAFIASNNPALQDLALNSAPHQDAPSTRGRNVSRKSSRVATARRRRSSSPHDQFALEQQQTVYDRVTKESQVLVPETDFGRTGSTVRPFRRVSEREPRPSSTAFPHLQNQDPNTSSSSRPPPPPPLGENRPPMIVPTTEEGFLGRQLYSTVVQYALSSTASQSTTSTASTTSCPHTPAAHDALSQLAGAWSHLDAIDPEAGLHLVRALLDRLQQNPQLHAMISPPPTAKPNMLVACSPSAKPLTKHRRGGSAVSARARRKGVDDGVLGLGEEARASAQIADVLYGRWVEGLRGRWGVVDK